METSLIGSSRLTLRSISRIQSLLAQAQQELSGGRHHDVGLTLGMRTGDSISLRSRLSELGSSATAMETARLQADVTQSALATIMSVADTFNKTLMSARSGDVTAGVLQDAARSAINNISGLLNTAFRGVFIFGGQNNLEAPLPSYEGSGGQTAVQDSFAATFGFTPDDPAVSSISAASLQSYLGGDLQTLFDPPSWQTIWTKASTENVTFYVGNAEALDLSSSASGTPFADLLRGMSAISEIASDALPAQSYEALIDHAIASVSSAQGALANEQGRIGFAQARLKSDADMQETLKGIVNMAISDLETVDPNSVAVRINELTVRLEASYALTARLSRMSLLTYI